MPPSKAYRVYYSPAEYGKSGTDLVGPSTFLYLLDPTGKIDSLLPSGVDAGKLAKFLRQVDR